MQVFSGDMRGLFVSTVVCPACLCFGFAATGADEFRERGSNRHIGLRGPPPFQECLCLWLTCFRSITSTSCISKAIRALERWLPVFLFLSQHCPDGPRRLVSHSSCCQSERLDGDDLRGPEIDRLWRTFRHHCARRHIDVTQLANGAITLLGDLAKRFLATAGRVERGEPQLCRQIVPCPKLMRVTDCGDNRRCCDRSNSRHAH